MAIHKPNFKTLLAAVDQYEVEDDKPTESNVDKLSTYLVRDMFDGCFGPIDDWDDVLEYVYMKLGFFRKYYCGIDISEEVYSGDCRRIRKPIYKLPDEPPSEAFVEHFDGLVVKEGLKNLRKESGTG